MEQIFSCIEGYFQAEWNPRLFTATGLFLAVCFGVNYGFGFEEWALAKFSHPLEQVVFYFFFYATPYAVTLWMYARVTKRTAFARQGEFYIFSLFAFVLLAVYVTLHNVPSFTLHNAPSLFTPIPKEYRWYLARYASNILPGLGIFVPLLLFWYRKDRDNSRLYGFNSSGIELKAYFLILLALSPVILAASFGRDFQEAYPRFKFGMPQASTLTGQASVIGVFEFCYGVDFLFVELLFRGFMVMAFARYLGSGAILPMVVVYAFIHFQKPMGEAIGSIAGGLVLGAISYRTKSIYGGIILHLGVAYLMEIAGTLHLLLR